MSKLQKVTQIDAARNDVVEAALSYHRALRMAMVNPDMKDRWNAAHAKLLSVSERLEQLKKPEPEPVEVHA